MIRMSRMVLASPKARVLPAIEPAHSDQVVLRQHLLLCSLRNEVTARRDAPVDDQRDAYPDYSAHSDSYGPSK